MDTAAPVRSTPGQDFYQRAATRLSLAVPAGLTDSNVIPPCGDHAVDPVMRAIAAIRPVRPAAVLIAVIDRSEPTVLLTQRTTGLTSHAGQIAFPGGKIDPTDASPLAAALREAEEEVGLDRHWVHPIGYLDVYMTTLGFRIAPIVARVDPGFTLLLNRAEVDDAFEVPLGFLMQRDNYQRRRREWRGLMRTSYAIPFGDRDIWGVTAGILRNLHERIYA
jgi:8-oxo-dGTP pyrophosphatase MutT (NUDIX family)